MTNPIDPAQLARALTVLRAAAASRAKQAIERGVDATAAFAESVRLELAAAEIIGCKPDLTRQ